MSGINLPHISASNTSSFLFDSFGRVRMFLGLNIVTKQYPWYEPDLLNASYVSYLAGQGISVVRLGLMWSGAEPEQGAFNMTYYNVLRSIIISLSSQGIYTLLDVHQDCLSSRFCLYDGIPLWVANKSVARKAFPWPLTGTCAQRPWAANELTEAAGQVLFLFVTLIRKWSPLTCRHIRTCTTIQWVCEMTL